jgi:hypothetical protein
MPQTSLDPLLTTIVLATLAVGLPILFVLAMRFLWDRNLKLDRSKELEKLIWQLHRIATAMEHQQRLSFPAVQPGTEEPRDLAYLQQLPVPPAQSAIAPAASPVAPAVPASAQPIATQQTAPPPPSTEPPHPAPLKISPDGTRHGVNSMFGL